MTTPFTSSITSVLVLALMIYTIWKIFKGKEIFIVEIKPQMTEFVIEKSGFYALWVHARAFSINPALAYPPTILNQDKQPIRNIPVGVRMNKIGCSGEAKQIYRVWYLKVGRYYLNVEHKERRFLKSDEQPNARYQLKETMPVLITMGVAMLILLAII